MMDGLWIFDGWLWGITKCINLNKRCVSVPTSPIHDHSVYVLYVVHFRINEFLRTVTAEWNKRRYVVVFVIILCWAECHHWSPGLTLVVGVVQPGCSSRGNSSGYVNSKMYLKNYSDRSKIVIPGQNVEHMAHEIRFYGRQQVPTFPWNDSGLRWELLLFAPTRFRFAKCWAFIWAHLMKCAEIHVMQRLVWIKIIGSS